MLIKVTTGKPSSRKLSRLGSMFFAWALLSVWQAPAYAFNVLELTDLEYDALPRFCTGQHPKKILGTVLARHNLGPRFGRPVPVLNDYEVSLRNKVGAWHYCHGLVKVWRAEKMPRNAERDAFVKDGLRDIHFTYRIIAKNEPWAAEVGVTAARAFRLLGEIDKANQYLDVVYRYHADYAPAYVAQAQLHFDNEDYPAAIEVLKRGEEATEGASAEVLYFLGLAHYYNGDIPAAKVKAEQAQALGYPLRGLQRKLRQHAASEASS